MSLKLLFLTTAAAGLIASPVAAGAQITGSRVNPGVQANDAAQTARDRRAERRAARAAAERVAAEADANAADGADGEPVTEAAAGTAAISAVDVRAGMPVLDTEGGQVGTIESVEADGAIVATGEARAKLPFASFGMSERGLVITMTRSELEAAVQARAPS